MEKYVLICWLFEELELSAKNVREILAKISEEEKEELDFLKVLENGNLEEHLNSVREVAKMDFVFEAVDFGVDYMDNWERLTGE